MYVIITIVDNRWKPVSYSNEKIKHHECFDSITEIGDDEVLSVRYVEDSSFEDLVKLAHLNKMYLNIHTFSCDFTKDSIITRIKDAEPEFDESRISFMSKACLKKDILKVVRLIKMDSQ